jgi:hypothetical protein
LGHKGSPTIILEAVASKDLRIWHAFFGMPGSHNDINVLQRSPIFDGIANGTTPPVNFVVNGNSYSMGYYLADKIYPDWSTLVKTRSQPANAKDCVYAKAQESVRKDMERTFGVLRARFRIAMNPRRLWSMTDMNDIVTTCVILHNMVVEDERHLHTDACEFLEPNDPQLHPTMVYRRQLNSWQHITRSRTEAPLSGFNTIWWSTIGHTQGMILVFRQ